MKIQHKSTINTTFITHGYMSFILLFSLILLLFSKLFHQILDGGFLFLWHRGRRVCCNICSGRKSALLLLLLLVTHCRSRDVNSSRAHLTSDIGFLRNFNAVTWGNHSRRTGLDCQHAVFVFDHFAFKVVFQNLD